MPPVEPARETVARLETSWRKLPFDEQQYLAFRWTDQAIRRLLAGALKRSGIERSSLLESLPEIIDLDSLKRGRAALEIVSTEFRARIESDESVPSRLAALVSDWLRELRDVPRIEDACRMILMLSSVAFDDDRVVIWLLTDIEMAWLRCSPTSE